MSVPRAAAHLWIMTTDQFLPGTRVAFPGQRGNPDSVTGWDDITITGAVIESRFTRDETSRFVVVEIDNSGRHRAEVHKRNLTSLPVKETADV